MAAEVGPAAAVRADGPPGAVSVQAGADPAPAGADPVPAGADPVPAAAVSVPAGADPVPAGADPVPAPAEPVPAVVGSRRSAGTDPMSGAGRSTGAGAGVVRAREAPATAAGSGADPMATAAAGSGADPVATAAAASGPGPLAMAAAAAGDDASSVGAAAAVATASDRGARVVAVAIALAWHGAIGLPAVLAAGPDLAAPVVVGAGWLVTAATGVLAGVRLLRDATVPARSLAALLLVVDAAVFAAAGEPSLFTRANWVWSTLGWFFLLVVWHRPVGWLLALLGAHSVIALVAVLGHGATAAADLTRYAMYVYGTSSLQVGVFVGSLAIASLARDRARAAAAALALETERIAAERARQERQARLALVSGAAEKVLAALAEGRADPADPDVQRRCVLATARLRRLIAESDDVPDPLLHELRAAADLAERNGLPIDLVTIGVPPPLPVEIRRRLAEPLTATLADARGFARLTVVSGPDEVVVSLVTPDRDVPDATGPPPPGVDDGPVEHVHERDGEIRWTQTRWRRR